MLVILDLIPCGLLKVLPFSPMYLGKREGTMSSHENFYFGELFFYNVGLIENDLLQNKKEEGNLGSPSNQQNQQSLRFK